MPDIVKAPINPVYEILDTKKAQLARLLPPERRKDAAQFQQMVITCLLENPKLAQCDPVSVLLAAACCAKLGLSPGKGLGHAYILPFGGEAVFMAGYKGLVELAYLSGGVTMVITDVVYEGDDFDAATTSEGFTFHHKRKFKEFTNDKIIAVYSRAKLASGDWIQEIMHIKEVEAIRDKSPSARYKKGPWFDAQSFKAMCRKTVFIQLAKWIQTNPQLSLAIAEDNRGSSDEVMPRDTDTLDVLGVDAPVPHTLDEPIVEQSEVVEEPKKSIPRKPRTRRAAIPPNPTTPPVSPPVEEPTPVPDEVQEAVDAAPVHEPGVDAELKKESIMTLTGLAKRCHKLGMETNLEERHGPCDDWSLDQMSEMIEELRAKLPIASSGGI